MYFIFIIGSDPWVGPSRQGFTIKCGCRGPFKFIFEHIWHGRLVSCLIHNQVYLAWPDPKQALFNFLLLKISK